MNAQEFWNSFRQAVMTEGENRTRLMNDWTTSRAFTATMTEIVTNIIKENYPKNEIAVQPEYLRIDIPAWRKNKGNNDTARCVKEETAFQIYDWNLEIAVEHENDYRLWMDEVVKLAHISCPLRVVIGYVRAEKDSRQISRGKTGKKQQAILDAVTDVLLQDVRAWQNMPEGNEFLIILGDANVRENDRCHYTPYLYRHAKKRFLPLDDGK